VHDEKPPKVPTITSQRAEGLMDSAMYARLIWTELALYAAAGAFAVYDMKTQRGMEWYEVIPVGIGIAVGELRRFLDRRQRRKAAALKGGGA
jgi:hypothetical protein